MKVNIQELLKAAGLNERFYPGKKLLKKYIQPGEFKSHCVLFDWSTEDIRVELKAGLTGKDLDLSDLKKYPVSYQAPTFLELQMADEQDNETEDEEGEEGTARGKAGGGSGKKPTTKKLEDSNISLSAFDKVTEGKITENGKISKFVVMGKELAQEAYGQALDNLKTQLSQAKVMAMDLMKDVGNVIKKATPGGGLKAKGNETIAYKYDAEKTMGLFGGTSPG